MAQSCIRVSILAMKMFAIVGATLVPMAVPIICWNSLFLNSKMLYLRTRLSKSMSVDVCTSGSFLLFKARLTLSMPSS